MTPAFRDATLDDTDLLTGFVRDFYVLERIPFNQQRTRAALGGLLYDHTLGRVWIITRDDAPIGYLALTFGYSLEYGGRDATLDELYIVAEQRAQGAGTAALAFVAERCRELGIHAVQLAVDHGNTVAHALYAKVGFVEQERYLMTKPIAP